MLKPRHYSIEEVYNNTFLSLQMSFFCAKYDKFIIEDIQKILNDKIYLSYDERNDFSKNILYKEYNGDKPRYILKLKYYNYLDIKLKMQYILEYLNTFAEFNFSTQLKVFVKYNYANLKTLYTVSKLNIPKLLYSFDENYIWNLYPYAKNSPITFSIKQCIPFTTYSAISNLHNLNNFVNYPIDEYYGIDLTEYTYDNISFNYLIGNYTSNIINVNDVIKYYVLKLYTVINSDDFTEDEKEVFAEMQNKYTYANRWYNTPDMFIKENPDIKISVNLRYDIQLIKLYWNKIRDQIYNLFIVGNIRKGLINYDTDLDKCQLKNCTIVDGIINNVDILNCTIDRSIIKNCEIWYTDIDNTRMYTSLLNNGCTIKNSIILKSTVKQYNTIESCYINNEEQIIEGTVTKSIIKYATISKRLKVDNLSIIISKNEYDPIINNGIAVDEVRDYNWIKSLNKNE